MTEKFKGTGVALITPFDKNLKIDFDSLKNLLHHTAENGVDYFVVGGTTGEPATLTKSEKLSVLKFVKENNSHNLPIVYGVGGYNTEELLEEIDNTDFKGVDAILSISPYYNKPSQQGIIKHYQTLADKSPVPIILYNVPGRTSSNLCATTSLTLAQHPNIIGIKEASGNLEQCMQIASDKPKDFLLISGDDILTVPMISIGAVGAISVLANAYPEIFKEMVYSALQQDFTKAKEAAFKFLEINPLMYKEGSPVGVKQLLEELNICPNNVRLPHSAASKELQNEIKKAVMNIEKVTLNA